MPFIETNNRRIIFIHIPKTGGTSVEYWLSRYGDLRLRSNGRPSGLKTTAQHLTWSDVTEMFGDNYFDYAFTIVRNPYARIESAYKMRSILGDSDRFPLVPEFSIWLRTHLERWRADPWHLDNHLRPQWLFVGNNVHSFKLEDGLSAALEAVAASNGLEMSGALPHAMASGSFKGDLNWDDAQIDMVRDAYGRDFERYGYDPDIVPVSNVTRPADLAGDTAEARLQRIGHRAFVSGSDPEAWYALGRLQFHFLVARGLRPHHSFLDVACGSLRLGQFLIPYLDRGKYQGLESTPGLVERGLGQEISPDLVTQKAPKFSFNSKFLMNDLNPFDIAIAHSLFTNLSRDDIRICFSSLSKVSKRGSKFYFTYFAGSSATNAVNSDPNSSFYYSISELASFSDPSKWRISKIGHWGHPQDQQMAVATACK